MTTINCIDSTMPIEISKGGTNTSSYSTNTFLTYNGTSIRSTPIPLTSSNVYQNSYQPGFLAYSTGATSVTGNGTAYTVIFNSVIFDKNSNYNNGTGVFTAPVTGKYAFYIALVAANIAAGHTSGNMQLVTTGRTYISNITNFYKGSCLWPYPDQSFRVTGQEMCVLADMSIGDTAHVVLTVSGITKTVNVYTVAPYTNGNRFQAFLLC